MPFVLGHAPSMKAIPGGQAKHDTIAASKIAVLLRGGVLPQAYVYPAERRATRDLLRRRMSRMRKRAALLAHVPPINHPYTLPESGKKSAYKANYDGVAQRFPDPAVQNSIAVDLAWIDSYACLRTNLQLDLIQTATAHEAHTCDRWRSLPGVGKILACVLPDELQDSHRCPHGQECVSSCRCVNCAKASTGQRDGTSGQKIGNTYLTWAGSEAARRCWRNNPAGHTYHARVAKTQGTGKALTVLAHPGARAVSDLVKRQTAGDRD